MHAHSRFLFPQTLPLPQAGQLAPVYISGMVEPIPDGDAGIGIATVESDLFCLINTYLDMKEDDALEVYLGGKQVKEFRLKPEEVNKRLYFYISKTEVTSGQMEIYYLLTRAGETVPDDPSVKLLLFIKLYKPAKDDMEPHLPWHSNLDAVGLPQDVIDNGVTQQWLATGVPMTIKPYPDIAPHDVLLVRWGSVALKSHQITQEEANGTAEIVVTAEAADILTAGNSNTLSVRYDVHDVVWNWADNWSKEATLSVDAGASHLEAAIFKEAVDGQIHLPVLEHEPVTLQILIESGNVFEAGDTLKIQIIGTPLPGNPPRSFTVEATVGNPPYIHEARIDYAFVKLFAMGTLDASYVLYKQDNSAPLSSKRSFANVLGDPSQLPAPEMKEVIGAVLPAEITTATVTISYPTMANGDSINLIWMGEKSDGTPYPYEQDHAVSDDEQKEERVTLYVAGEHIHALNNGKLKLYYRVSNDTSNQYGIFESDFLKVDVGSFSATLPAPEVEEAKDGVLDPSQIDTQAHVLVKPLNWARDDKLTYHWIGINPNGTTQATVPITAATIGESVRFRVPVRFVSANEGHDVTVVYTLLHAETGQYSYSTPLQVRVGLPLGQ